ARTFREVVHVWTAGTYRWQGSWQSGRDSSSDEHRFRMQPARAGIGSRSPEEDRLRAGHLRPFGANKRIAVEPFVRRGRGSCPDPSAVCLLRRQLPAGRVGVQKELSRASNSVTLEVSPMFPAAEPAPHFEQ